VSERPTPFGDPLTEPFWAAAERHEFVLQRCAGCGAFQFYPRPFCLRCGSADVAWVPSAGTGTIHSQTTVHVPVIPELTPPYVVALIQLDEGPRYTAGIVGGPSAIGDRVRLTWRDREGRPPLPVFTPDPERHTWDA
jgi:uncharacterized OB-fold protein